MSKMEDFLKSSRRVSDYFEHGVMSCVRLSEYFVTSSFSFNFVDTFSIFMVSRFGINSMLESLFSENIFISFRKNSDRNLIVVIFVER